MHPARRLPQIKSPRGHTTRRPLIALLGVVLAVGGLVVTPSSAHAAVIEARVPLAIGTEGNPTPVGLLGVAPDRVVGADNRAGSPYYPPVWTRSVSAAGFGPEVFTPVNARWYGVSAARTAIKDDVGLEIYERGQLKNTFYSQYPFSGLTGPYLYRITSGGATVFTTRGEQIAVIPTPHVDFFGSRYVTYLPDSNLAGPMHLTVKDLTSPAAGTTVDLPAGTAACFSGRLWGDVTALPCPDGVHVYNILTGASVGFVPGGVGGQSQINAIGDGYVLVETWNGSRFVKSVATFGGSTADSMTGCVGIEVTDGVGHVLCESTTELIWKDLSSLSTSAGRVLGWQGPASFSAAWTPEVDVTKAFAAGKLVIKQGSTVVREVSVPASADGSVRDVAWDGKNTAGVVVPPGAYTAELVVSGKDGSGPVKAVDGVSAPTFQVTRFAAGAFVPLSPARLLDTRQGTWIYHNDYVDLQVTGQGGVPATGVGAVILNVTAVSGQFSQGFLTVYPSGEAQPNASNVNFTRNQVVPNLVLAKVSADGRVRIQNSSTSATNVVVDVSGYFVAGEVADPGALSAVTPSRLLDTRESGGAVAPSGSVKVQATGHGGVPPSGVAAVVVNLTAVTPTAWGFLTAYPTGGAVPNASNVNFTAGQVVPNLAFVKLGADGSFTVKNTSPGSTQVVADVAGYVLDGAVTGSGMFVPLSPTRVLDTRPAYGGGGALGANSARVLTMSGAGGVPATGVSGVVLNVTAVASAAGFVTVYPADVGAPNASNVNFTAGQVVPNLVAVKTSGSGQVAIRNSSLGATNVIADVAGYFTA